MLQQKLPAKFRSLPATHMVCFPDLSSKDVPDLPDLPRELRICGDELTNLADKLLQAAAFSRGSEEMRQLTSEGVRTLAELLKPNFSGPGRWALVAQMQQKIIDELTDDQRRILGYLTTNRLIGLTGPAGCGKTIVALRWVRDLASENKRVLCVLPTALLGEYYRGLLPQRAFVHLVSPQQLLESTFVNATLWNAIIVDEAQDLSLETWELIEAHLNGAARPSLLALYDSNQRLSPRGSFYIPSGIAEVYLDRVIRNTREIAELSSLFFRDGQRTMTAAGPKGIPVQEIPIDLPSRLPEAVGSFIKRLVHQEGFDFSDIVVLTGGDGRLFLRRNPDAAAVHGISYRGIQASWGAARKHPLVACGPVTAFRGMESPVVILTDVDEMVARDLLECCYVGISRARHVLAIVAKPQTLARLRTGSEEEPPVEPQIFSA
jgi:hypothetical protein